MKKVDIYISVIGLVLITLSSSAQAGRWLQQVGHDRSNHDILVMSGETPPLQYRSDTQDYLEVVIDTNGNGQIDRGDGSFVEAVSGRFSVRLNISQYHGRLAEITLWDQKDSELVGNNPGWVMRKGYSVGGRHDGMRDTLQ